MQTERLFNKDNYIVHKIQGENNIKVYLEDTYQINRKNYDSLEEMCNIDPLLRLYKGILYQKKDKFLKD